MNAGEFARRRARIDHEHGRRKGYARKALASLVREAGAVAIVIEGRVAGWKLPNGQTVCKKRRYRTELDAQLALVAIKGHPLTPRIPGRVYRCGFCMGWHLTSQRLATETYH